MSSPVVWLPFAPDRLIDPPDSLTYELFTADNAVPDSIDRVEFFCPPYQLSGDLGQLWGQMTSLRVVQTLTAGVDAIRAGLPEGVLLCNARGVHDASTAELAVTLTLASLRDVPSFVRGQDRHAWLQAPRPALADKTVLIVGYGQIGAAIEARLTPFEVSVMRVARSARDGVSPVSDLPDLLPEADVVILIVPGTEETRHLVDAGFLARMRDGALLVNVARGGVVDHEALLAELDSGRLRAALDVTDPEPLPAGHPLWDAPHLLLTPHVGGATDAMWPRAYRLVSAQLRRFANGETLANQMTGAY